MRRYPHGEPVDAVVIGLGAGGAPIAARLAEAGCSVVALEAGRWWSPADDFATDEEEQNKLFWLDERLSAGADPIAFGANNSGTGVGGSTLHWTAYAPRAQADDLRLASGTGLGRDWPIAHAELVPYYEEVERFIGVSGPADYPWGDPRRYPLPPLPLNAPARLMAQGCEALGLRTAPAPNAALSGSYYREAYGHRPACTNRGFCQAGCSNGAKASVDVTYVPAAVRAGAEVRDRAYVTAFERDREGRITRVAYLDADGAERAQACANVFLCAGGVESPRLLLIHGLANGSGQVGRNFMAHPGLQIWGLFDEPTRPTRGIPGALISEDTHRPADADFAGGYLLQSIGVMPVTYAGQLARGSGLWGRALVEHMARFDHVAGINMLGDCLPDPDNRITLSDEIDARGLPKPIVTFANGPNERAMTAHADRVMRGVWDAAGARDVWAFPRNAHTIGGCRMGTGGAQAVVDADCRSFDVPNLLICDNSVFPSALSVNPALTQMALSLRTADRFLEGP